MYPTIWAISTFLIQEYIQGVTLFVTFTITHSFVHLNSRNRQLNLCCECNIRFCCYPSNVNNWLTTYIKSIFNLYLKWIYENIKSRRNICISLIFISSMCKISSSYHWYVTQRIIHFPKHPFEFSPAAQLLNC